MVTSVSAKVYAPRIGVAGARPRNIRFAEALATADREIPKGSPHREGLFGLYCSEENIDLINAAIEKARHERVVASAPNPRVVEHCREIYALLEGQPDTLNQLARKINGAQSQLLSLRNDPRYKKLGDRILPADCIVALPLLNTDYYSPDRFKTPDESKAARDDVHTRRLEALRVWSLISTALAFKDLPRAEQAMQLVLADVDDERVLKRRITALESEVAALRAIVTKRKSKPRKAA
jgi:hypothetical protein